MSFTSHIKEEVVRSSFKTTDEEKAFLAGILRMQAKFYFLGQDRFRAEFTTDFSAGARRVLQIIHELYQIKTELVFRRSVLHKTVNYLIVIPEQTLLLSLMQDLGLVNSQGILTSRQTAYLTNKACKIAYLQGIFVACAFVSKPSQAAHFEMSFESSDMATSLQELLCDESIPVRLAKRRKHFALYLKSGKDISELLGLIGAHQAKLVFEEHRVVKSVRNDVNRLVNAEMANQAKSAQSSLEQLQAIKIIYDAGSLPKLSPALRSLAQLRIAHPSASLKELGELSRPKLSKSAVYHRVRRLEQIAHEIQACKPCK